MAEVDLRRTSIFVRVVEAGSFSAAATALGLPTSSVSRSVAGLEEELGVRLLHRTSRKLTLTDAGQTYFGRMQAVLAEANEATQEVINFGGDLRGLVRVTAPGRPGRAVPACHDRHAVRAAPAPGDRAVTDQPARRSGRRGLRPGDPRRDPGRLVAGRAQGQGDRAVHLRRAAYVERRGRPRTVADVAGHDCVVYRTRGGKLPWRLTGPRGVETAEANGPIAADDMLFVRELVLQGAGLG